MKYPQADFSMYYVCPRVSLEHHTWEASRGYPEKQPHMAYHFVPELLLFPIASIFFYNTPNSGQRNIY